MDDVSNILSSELFRNETKEEYWARLNQSVAELEAGKGVVFTMEELENYIHGKSGNLID